MNVCFAAHPALPRSEGPQAEEGTRADLVSAEPVPKPSEPVPKPSEPAPSQIYGVRHEDGYWVKADPGYQKGKFLEEEFRAANITTLAAIVENAATKLGNKPCMGVRQGLAKICPGVSRRVAIFAETRAEWFMSAMGCLRQGLTIVTVFPNLSVEEIVASLCETEVNVLIVSHATLKTTAEVISKCSAIKHVIVLEDQLEGVGIVPEVLKNVSVIPFHEVVATGKGLNASLRQPTAEDVAIILYTSGSMSLPKGTELTHANVIATVIGYAYQSDLRPDDRYLAFLPLAHVLEFCCEIALVSLNLLIMYGSPMTLTNNSPKVMQGTLGDVQVARPTYINAVPLILDRIVRGVTEKV
ncbi:long chain acyl-CoA synthetase 9, chloroplastic-like [Penaeus chinensis]|uniref:long chain acyl-CoA synthetase 9, chloroplastic-like n=1 Tax=Penaeus chinensis TaxID=139456 RepID=UPI001FB621A6|nr:long chain acyl-CoA synthetase 9, chloroplastic-like [Penaeus chinensis]